MSLPHQPPTGHIDEEKAPRISLAAQLEVLGADCSQFDPEVSFRPQAD